MTANEARKKFIKEIRDLSVYHGLNTVFTTFLEITATSLAAQVDPVSAPKHEARYREMIKDMSPETLDAFIPECFR